MRMDKNKQEKAEKKKTDGKKACIFSRIWSVMFLLLSAAFIGMVFYLNVLAVEIAVGVAASVLVIDLIIFAFLWRKKTGKGARIAAFVISLLITACFASGIYYIANTMDFLSDITEKKAQITEFDVVVKADSKYKEIGEIKGKELLVLSENSSVYSEARNELKEVVEVEYKAEDDINGVLDMVSSDNEIAFISSGQYGNALENNSEYKESTRVLYTIKIETEKKDISKGVDVTKDPFNVYITGIDTTGTIDTVSRSDVNMVVTVNPETRKILMTSIPRDSYVELQGQDHFGQMDKFTHTGIYGVEESVATAEAMLGIDINYYLKVNFTTVTELIDVIGGIDVESDLAFVSRDGYYYSEGMNHLNGAEALSFARERKAFSDGDFQRNRDQQLVLEAVIKKGTTSTTILKNYTDILGTVKDYMETNMSAKDIKKLIKMQLGDMSGWDIEMQAIKGSTGSAPCFSVGNAYASVVFPDEQLVLEAGDKITAVMSSEEPEAEKADSEEEETETKSE